MRNGKTLPAAASALGMLILILDGKTALSGGQAGIELCIRTLIPSLFPYLALSALLTGSLTGQPLKLLRPVGKAMGIPEGAESLLATGLLGGYPAGAMNVSLAYRRGQLSQADARRMLPICNNAGPAFLFGIIAPMFSRLKTAWILWAIQIISAVLVGILTADRTSSSAARFSREITVTQALEQAVRTMGMICGWVVLFRIMLAFTEQWFFRMLPAECQVLLCGLLELSNGCVLLGSVENEGMRFVLASLLLSLGGLCVAMQTASAAADLTLRGYFPAKLLQCCISFLLSLLLQISLPLESHWNCPQVFVTAVLLLTIILSLKLKRNKKTSSNPAICGV